MTKYIINKWLQNKFQRLKSWLKRSPVEYYVSNRNPEEVISVKVGDIYTNQQIKEKQWYKKTLNNGWVKTGPPIITKEED